MFLSGSTIEKVNVLGTNFLAALTADIDMDYLPACVGGKYDKPPEPFEFDVCEGGLIWTPPSHDRGTGEEKRANESSAETTELHDV